MKTALLLFLAASALRFDILGATGALHFEITDARGKKPAGVAVEASGPDEHGWYRLTPLTKGRGHPVLVWPFDGRAKAADGPGEIPVIVVESGDVKALANPRVLAAIAASQLLGESPATDLGGAELNKALSGLVGAEDSFAKGVGLLWAKRPADAAEALSRALKERERQLTRVPSEIYPAAILCGRAFLEANQFDDAAVAFLKALKQRPNDALAARLRAEALTKAGKPEAR